MTDKEVGELWHRQLTELEAMWPDRKGAKAFEMDQVIALIRKLVEERARYYRHAALRNYDYNLLVDAALRDFGIDPATWPKE